MGGQLGQDELALGLRICLAVLGVALGKHSLERLALIRQCSVRAQAITKAQASLELPCLVNEVQVMRAHRVARVAKEASVNEGRVECRPELVAGALGERGDRCVEIIDERDHSITGLAASPGTAVEAEAMDLGAGE